MSDKETSSFSRRAALAKGGQALAAIGIVCLGARPVFAKAKASKGVAQFAQVISRREAPAVQKPRTLLERVLKRS